MNITVEYLSERGFVREDYGGKVFYRMGNYMISYDDIYGWSPCDPATHCFTCHIETVEELERLMAEARENSRFHH